MGEEFIIVAIFDADQPVETRRCRLVHLPDDTRAALWRGLAWPIGTGDRIDVAGPAFPSCPKIRLAARALASWTVLKKRGWCWKAR